MSTRHVFIALGIGAYLAFVLSSMPAAVGYRLLNAVSPDTVRLSGIEGTVWSGRAALGSAAGLPLRDVTWRAQALPLLLGRVAAHVQARLSDGFVETDVRAGTSAVLLNELRISTSVATLAPLIPLQGASGQLSVSLARLRLEGGWPTRAIGEARIAELQVPPLLPSGGGELIPLGSYDVAFVEAETGIAARIRDTGGPLQVEGSLTLTPDRRYALEGRAAARPDAPPELVQGLEIMAGEPAAGGLRPFSLTGSL
ncbi:MAG: type II secretion system protein N [Gammaproteobacteria bacterium]|nr:type II secretion system protein N [Gammaproteobacteria bacterium]